MDAVAEATVEETEAGQVVRGEGWFILNLGEARWERDPDLGTWCNLGAHDAPFSQFGIGPHMLMPGQPNGRYHAEAAQEGFLVLSGECIAIVEGQERRMRQWDYLHSPPGTAHITIGAGDEPCAMLMFGSPDPSRKVSWIADELAAKHGVSVARTTSKDTEAYGEDIPDEARVPAPKPFGA